MADPVTNNYSLILPTVGGDTNLWGGVLNSGVITALDTILSGALAVSITSSDVTLTDAQFVNAFFVLSGTLTGNKNLIIPLGPNSATVACAGHFIVDNATAGAFTVTVKTEASGSTGVTVPQGLRAHLYSDGINVKYADDSKVYVVSVSGTPQGQLAGTAGSVNNPPFPLAYDYTNKRLYLPVTSGDATTTVWNNFVIGSAPTPVALFAGLAVKVTGNTTATVEATGVTVTDGAGNYQTVVPPGTGTPINFASTGANALDTGSIAAATWYAVWVIAKIDGTCACLVSTSATLAGLTLPTDYTYAGRVGWLRTASGVAQLMGTWQLGRSAQYIIGLAQTTTPPVIASGAAGSTTVPTYAAVAVGAFVPTTASKIVLTIADNNDSAMAAPNSSYGTISSITNPPALSVSGAASAQIRSNFVSMLLESTNVYWASNNANGRLLCYGWEDNI